MKIEPSKNKKINTPYNSKSNYTGSGRQVKTEFSNIVSKGAEQYFIDDFNEELEQTIQELDVIVAKFKKSPADEQVLFQYKNRLARFTAKAVSMYQEKQFDVTGSRRKRNTKVLLSFKIIDENLREMTAEILKSEKGRIDVLAKLDMLRGLLLDMRVGR